MSHLSGRWAFVRLPLTSDSEVPVGYIKGCLGKEKPVASMDTKHVFKHTEQQ